MAEVAGRTVYLVGTENSIKSILVTFTTAATGDTITMSSGQKYQCSTIVAWSVARQDNAAALASVTMASNVLTLGVTTGVQSGFAFIEGF